MRKSPMRYNNRKDILRPLSTTTTTNNNNKNGEEKVKESKAFLDRGKLSYVTPFIDR